MLNPNITLLNLSYANDVFMNTSVLRLLALRGLRTLCARTWAYGPRVAGGMQVYTVAGVQMYCRTCCFL